MRFLAPPRRGWLVRPLLLAFGLLAALAGGPSWSLTAAHATLIGALPPVSLTAAHSGKCLNLPGGLVGVTVELWQYTCHGGTNQQWAVSFNPDGSALVRSQVNVTYCLDVRGNSLAEGAPVQVLRCTGAANQRWFIRPVSGAVDTYTLVSALSNKCLDVPGLSQADQVQVAQYTCNGGPNQQWRSGAVIVRHLTLSPTGTNLCLDVAFASLDNGAQVAQYNCNGGTNQHWAFTPVAGANATYTIAAEHSGKCLDVPGFSTTSGTVLQQFDCTGGTNQQWLVTRSILNDVSSGNRLTLVSVNSGKCMDVPGFSTAEGTLIDQNDCVGTSNQKWSGREL